MIERVIDNWALVAASVLVTALVVQAIFVVASRSPAARLRRAWSKLQERRQAAKAAARKAGRASRACARLQAKARSVRPVKLEQAQTALSDCEALLKIANDQVLVAENHVRRIIVEQFPPAKQARLRARYQVSESPGDKPFTFQG